MLDSTRVSNFQAQARLDSKVLGEVFISAYLYFCNYMSLENCNRIKHCHIYKLQVTKFIPWFISKPFAILCYIKCLVYNITRHPYIRSYSAKPRVWDTPFMMSSLFNKKQWPMYFGIVYTGANRLHREDIDSMKPSQINCFRSQLCKLKIFKIKCCINSF